VMLMEVAEFAVDFAAIVWRGIAKLLRLRRGEKPSSLESGQSVVAAVIVLGVLTGIAALAIRWLFTF
jgi:hypothetical protein